MTAFRINLLGRFEVRTAAGEPVAVPAAKARALLAFLALRPGQAQSRDKLAALLWEESGEVQARASLRQALVALRRSLGPAGEHAVTAAADSVALGADAAHVDVAEFERLARDGAPDALEAAVALYQGELLDAFHPRAPAFEDWLLAERERLREIALEALRTLLALHLEAGRAERALHLAVRLLSLDPLQEPVHRTLMALYARQGRQAAALKQYHHCRALLQRELGIGPEPETDQVYREILRQRRQRQRDDANTTIAVEGAPSELPVEEAAEDPVPQAPELRQAAVLFAGLADLGARGPEETGDLLNRYFEIVDAVVESYGGAVATHLGETVMAVFGAPVAHGNDGERAVLAALDIHRFVADLEGMPGQTLAAHIGIAGGRVLAGEVGSARHRERTVTGEPVTLAAKLASRAADGETLISATLYDDVRHRFECEPADPTDAASGSAPWRVRAARAEPAPRPTACLVGREAEQRQFAGALAAVADVGCGQVVFIRGEAGIGKTRLVQELAAMGEARGFAGHRGLVVDFGIGSGGGAIRSLVASLAEAPPGADLDDRQARVERIFAAGELQDEHRMFLYDMLGLPQPPALHATYEAMDNEARNGGKHRAIAALLRARSARRPLLLIVEDIHWAEPVVLAYLAKIAAAVKSCAALLAVTARSEGDPLDATWRAAARGSPLTTIDLGPLEEHEALALAGQHAGADEGFARSCVARAEGNPLFLEQLLHAGDAAEELPGSVQSLVLARMDRLPPLDRRALQAAAVLGQRFSPEPLRHLVESPDYCCAGLLRQVLVRVDGETFLFAHALVRDGAYGSLPKAQRRALHRRAADWYAERDLILHAEHLDRADDPAAALAYLRAAGEQAAGYRYERAMRLAERGLELACDRPARFQLTCLRGDMLRDLGRAEDSIAAFRASLELAEEASQQSRVWIGIAGAMRVVDRHYDALEALRKAEAAAAEGDLANDLARIHYLRGNVYFPLGDIDGCLGEHKKALVFAQEATSPRNEARALGGLGDAYYQRGRMITAHDYFGRCVALAREHGFGRIEVSNLYMAALTRAYGGDLRGAADEIAAASEAAARIGHLRAELVSMQIATELSFDLARLDQTKDHLERALALARRLGSGRFEASALTYEAKILHVEGRDAEARARLDQTMAIGRRTGISFFGPRILAEIAGHAAGPAERRAALEEGERILHAGSVGHNHLHFYREAIDVALRADEWDEAERYARALEDHFRPEPLGWSDFFAARGRALAAWGRGARDETILGELERLRADGSRCGFEIALPAIDAALSGRRP